MQGRLCQELILADIVMMGPRHAGTFRLVFMSRSFFSDDPIVSTEVLFDSLFCCLFEECQRMTFPHINLKKIASAFTCENGRLGQMIDLEFRTVCEI